MLLICWPQNFDACWTQKCVSLHLMCLSGLSPYTPGLFPVSSMLAILLQVAHHPVSLQIAHNPILLQVVPHPMLLQTALDPILSQVAHHPIDSDAVPSLGRLNSLHRRRKSGSASGALLDMSRVDADAHTAAAATEASPQSSRSLMHKYGSHVQSHAQA